MKKYIFAILVLSFSFSHCAVYHNEKNLESMVVKPSKNHPFDGKWKWTYSKVCQRTNPPPTTPASCDCSKTLIIQKGVASFFKDEKLAWSEAYALHVSKPLLGEQRPLMFQCKQMRGYITLENNELKISTCAVDGSELKFTRI